MPFDEEIWLNNIRAIVIHLFLNTLTVFYYGLIMDEESY